jgi:hypothetical protein
MDRNSSFNEDDALVNLDVHPRKNRLRELCDREPCLATGIVIIVFLIVFIIVLSVTSYFTGISASLIMMREHHRHHTCDEEQFGCCKIYLECNDKNTYLDFEEITLSHYRVLPRDRVHSNCPSLENLFMKYNEHYGVKDDDDCGEFGCCDESYDIGCDETIRETFKTGNNEDTIYSLKNNTRIMDVKIAKDDEGGSNCMNHNVLLGNIIYAYESLYPDKSGSTDIISVILILVAFWLLVVCVCGGQKRSRL